MQLPQRRSRARVAFSAASLVLLAFILTFPIACSKQTSGSPLPVSVEVAPVTAGDVPVYSEWTASTDGLTNVAVRAQVQGYLVSQKYHEGEFVKKGQVLFEIDPRPFVTALEQAEAGLAEARSRWENAKTHLNRVRPLAEQHAVSTRDLDEATSSEGALRALLEGAKAAKRKAEIDLGFTRIVSPINGIAGWIRSFLKIEEKSMNVLKQLIPNAGLEKLEIGVWKMRFGLIVL